MAARSRGNGTVFNWLRKSCDISTCDLSSDRNLENYVRPMKSAIIQQGTSNPPVFSECLLPPLQFSVQAFE